MSERSPQQGTEGAGELDLFDYALIRNVLRFILHGVRRHLVLSALVLFGVAALGLGVVMLLPRTYHAESRLLASQNELIRALGNPRSALPSEDPTRAARELIFAHQNLVSLIKQTDLMKNWEAHRPAVVKLRDTLARAVLGPPTEQDEIDMMVGTLERRLRVDTDRQTVSISVDWPDAQMAYLLVETAQQNFLETRHVTEMTAISEALSILEMHASNVQRTVDDALHELERVRELRRRGQVVAFGGAAPREAGVGAAAPPAPDRPPSPADVKAPGPLAATEQELAQLKFLLLSKRRALQDLEDSRVRRVGELATLLQTQLGQYTEQHPAVLDTQKQLAAVREDSPQMSALKRDIEQLMDEYKRKGGRSPDSWVEQPAVGSGSSHRPLVSQIQGAMTSAELADDPMIEFARNNLRVAAAKYEELMMRIDGARIEQDTARAAFKYRYSIIRPASVPTKPVRPNVLLLAVAVLLVALVTALFSGAVRDVWSACFLESWQVERALGLQVLSEVKPR